MKTIALTAFFCLQTLISPPSVEPLSAKSALTNYPTKEAAPVRPVRAPKVVPPAVDAAESALPKSQAPPSTATMTNSVDSTPRARTLATKAPPSFAETVLAMGNLNLKAVLQRKSASDQAIVSGNAYVEILLVDQTRSRPVGQTRGVLNQKNNEVSISAHFDPRVLKPALTTRTLDNMHLIISLRQYEWFGRGERLDSVNLELKPLLEQLVREPFVKVTIPNTQTIFALSLAPPNGHRAH